MGDGRRLGAGPGNAQRLGTAGTGGQTDQQAKGKNYTHGESLRPDHVPVHRAYVSYKD
jgi:hypothetical protein